MKRLLSLAVVVVFAFLFSGYHGCAVDSQFITFSGLTANGESRSMPTTVLTLTFDTDPTMLTDKHIAVYAVPPTDRVNLSSRGNRLWPARAATHSCLTVET